MAQQTTETNLTSDFDDIPPDFRSGFVAVVGRPNVGKSTIMNAFLGQKVAIVSPRPQTTRQRQLGIVSTDTFQMIFVDTPGIMTPRHKLDEYMLETAMETLADADTILWLVDASEPPGRSDRDIAELLQVAAETQTVILAMNKNDLLAADQVMERVDTFRSLLPPNVPWILFSALQEQGRQELWQMLVDSLPLGPRYFPPDQITDMYLRDIAAEMVREQVLRHLKDEVPHGTAVQVQQFKERDNGTTYIEAVIFVERSNHKRIVIGKNGKLLQQIGVKARKEIEALIEGKVYLKLWVKVEPKWRRKENMLRRFGYSQRK